MTFLLSLVVLCPSLVVLGMDPLTTGTRAHRSSGTLLLRRSSSRALRSLASVEHHHPLRLDSATLFRLRGGDIATAATTATASAITPQAVATYVAAAALTALTVGLVRNVPRSQGRAPKWVSNIVRNESFAKSLFHTGYFLHCVLVVRLMPRALKQVIFSPGSVLLLGTVFPIVESIRAAATDFDGVSSTRVWLQYWIIHGLFHYSTEFVDKIADRYPAVHQNWFPLEFYTILHLILPFTDGAALVYELFTLPYLVPTIKPIAEKCEGWLTSLALTVVNASHIWWFAAIFVALPLVLKRAAVIAVGTAYPLVGTIVAVARTDGTSASVDDKSTSGGHRWLTYWSCFSLVYLAMVAIETLVGKRTPGLYTLALATTLYLMLPMFDGSEQVFRKILVPISGHREALIIKDARVLAKELAKKLPADRQVEARKAAAAAFLEKTE